MLFCLFALILYIQSTIFSYVGTGLPGLNQYLARINVSCSRTQCSDAGEARTRGLESSTLPLSHCAPINMLLFDWFVWETTNICPLSELSDLEIFCLHMLFMSSNLVFGTPRRTSKTF